LSLEPRKLEYIENVQSLGLARENVSEFFDKTIPLDKPNMPNTYILAWASLALSDIFTFGFNNTDFRLGLASNYFTEPGWEDFAKILKDRKIIDNIRRQQQIVTASPNTAPILQSENVVNGIRQWVIQVPMNLTYQAGSKVMNSKVLVTLVIVRSADPKYPYGIAINQMVAPYP
jgi:intracellular multiplication protein IcmL